MCTTATELIAAHSGQAITRAQARELATLARALAVLKDPSAAELLDLAKAAEVAAKGRPAARVKKERPARSSKGGKGKPDIDHRPLAELDPSYWGVLRPVVVKGEHSRGKVKGPGRVSKPKKRREVEWDGDLGRSVCCNHARPDLGVTTHRRGYFCGAMIGPWRAEEVEHLTREGVTGQPVATDLDAIDVSAALEGDAMERLEEVGALYVDDRRELVALLAAEDAAADAVEPVRKARGKRLNGSRRDRGLLTPGQQRRARARDRMTAAGYKKRPDRTRPKRVAGGERLLKALAIAARYMAKH